MTSTTITEISIVIAGVGRIPSGWVPSRRRRRRKSSRSRRWGRTRTLISILLHRLQELSNLGGIFTAGIAIHKVLNDTFLEENLQLQILFLRVLELRTIPSTRGRFTRGRTLPIQSGRR